jgi:phenylalanine-4-hydroxylase
MYAMKGVVQVVALATLNLSGGFGWVTLGQQRYAVSVCRGECIADVEYLPEELATWGTALKQLQGLVPKYGCTNFVQAFHDMNFRPDSVPQLQGIHEQLQAATGWNIRPVAGLMHPREFLNGLAFKTFHSTQYMRHHSNPVYTPEPDVVHELLGVSTEH